MKPLNASVHAAEFARKGCDRTPVTEEIRIKTQAREHIQVEVAIKLL